MIEFKFYMSEQPLDFHNTLDTITKRAPEKLSRNQQLAELCGLACIRRGKEEGPWGGVG